MAATVDERVRAYAKRTNLPVEVARQAIFIAGLEVLEAEGEAFIDSMWLGAIAVYGIAEKHDARRRAEMSRLLADLPRSANPASERRPRRPRARTKVAPVVELRVAR